MVFVPYFLLHFLCAYFSCNAPYEEPSDPLNLTLRSGRKFDILDPNPIVVTNFGAVEGYITKSILGKPIYTFEGIPYGETTGGVNRFKSPIPKKPWKGIRQAKSPGSPCIQLNTAKLGAIVGREDCLFLNIYSAHLPSSNESESQSNLPVIVWFHGGGFHFGSGDEYGPAYLLDHDMILVTVNYRLGIYGFLSTLDDASPGNYGLKDQALALKWIHSNIKYFGGNSSLIALMGQSAGGTAVHLHMISSQSKPYFSGGIAFSGNGLSSWSVLKPKHVGVMNQKLANRTGCSLKSSTKFVSCIRSMNPYNLARREAFLADWLQWPVILLGPVVEPKGPDSFLIEYPADAYKNGHVAKYPLILSMTSDEGDQAAIFLDALLAFRSFTSKWKERAPLFLDYQYLLPPEEFDEITNKITKFYFGKTDPRNVNSRVYGRITTDALFYYPLHKSIEAHSRIAPTYAAMFGFKGSYGFGNLFGFSQDEYGVSHTDDIWYYLNSSTYLPGFKTTDPDYKMVKFMTNWIYNFALTREPFLVDENQTEYRGVWNPINDSSNIELLCVESAIKIMPEPRSHVLKFWESLGIYD